MLIYIMIPSWSWQETEIVMDQQKLKCASNFTAESVLSARAILKSWCRSATWGN